MMRRIFLSALLLVLMAKGGVLQNGCKVCPPGLFLDSCMTCAACPSGSYTYRPNQEKRCLPCSKDCSAEFNMKVVEACSTTADMKCGCMAGYSCTSTDPLTKKCSQCEKDSSAEATTVKVRSTTVSTTPPTLTTRSRTYFVSKGIRKPTARKVIHTSTAAPIKTGEDERMKDAVPPVSHQGVLVLMLVMSIGLLALLVVLLLSRGRGGAGLRKFMKGHFPSSNKGSITEVTPRRPKANVQHKEIHPDSLPPAAHHDHTPASSLPGTLGPLYIQQSSTVVVSLLNEFSTGDSAAAAAAGGGGGRRGGGGGGGRRGGGGGGERAPGGGGGCDEEEQRADYTAPRAEEVGPPPPSPLPLSTEERTPTEEAEEEISSPYQEQGKESHMSKEEEH